MRFIQVSLLYKIFIISLSPKTHIKWVIVGRLSSLLLLLFLI